MCDNQRIRPRENSALEARTLASNEDWRQCPLQKWTSSQLYNGRSHSRNRANKRNQNPECVTHLVEGLLQAWVGLGCHLFSRIFDQAGRIHWCTNYADVAAWKQSQLVHLEAIGIGQCDAKSPRADGYPLVAVFKRWFWSTMISKCLGHKAARQSLPEDGCV